MRREVVFGVSVGTLLASIGFLRVMVGNTLVGGYGEQWAQVGIAVGISLVVVVLWGVLIGSMLPFIMRSLGADPAVSSTPFVATVADVTGLILYLTIATLLLG